MDENFAGSSVLDILSGTSEIQANDQPRRNQEKA
jgi:hypothetical protein